MTRSDQVPGPAFRPTSGPISVTEYGPSSGPDFDRPRLFVDVQHGLCNRLRAWASGAAIARATGRELVLVWCPDAHCQARIGDLFLPSGLVIEDRAVADLARRHAAHVYNYMEVEPGARFEAPILAEEAAQQPPDPPQSDVYIRSAYTLQSPHSNLAAEQAFLRRLTPAPEIADLMARVPHPNPVAVHIRMATGPGFDHLAHESPDNWPPERHRELVRWRAASHWERFAQRLDQLVEENRATRIFVAADLPETYAALEQRLPGRILSLKRDLFDRSRRQLQYALADLLLLGAADLFLASTWSSFSDVAQRLAPPNRPFERSGIDF